MDEEDKSLNIGREKVESKEGERGLLSSNKANTRFPSLNYNYIENSECLDRAFDILFDQVIKDIGP